MDDVTVEVKGLAELQQALEQLPTKFANRGVRAALNAGGNIIRNGMAALAPKDTGFLEEHFNVKLKLLRGGLLGGSAFIGPNGKIDYPAYVSGAYNIVRNAKNKAIKVGRVAVATVARYLEFGTAKMAKKPFMTQAFETRKEAALAAITNTLRIALESAVADSPKRQ
jgi:HK97 gp10 family phage protein